ncbi:GlxA family transcriptional regulator [Kitasatospora xanthocidica]|uniref:GlxA family transcriptional regulator n=1 Tax=Kitasatospora xanthocidica TaxID=83382 RepID=A0A372ZWC4_9ACTN|nr:MULTISPECIES: GlxA family transcriptional regulator [Streptomycetaceae]OKI01778.1 AraC family transcriptional regulator [Streptomyces sp. CB02056]RGD59742.1 GlxA family transcriptional regulator [Kitasatospora xanthocidica]
MRAHSVVIVLFEGVQSLDVTGPLEVFAGAGRAAGQPAAYRVTTASPGGGPVRSHSGLRLLPDADLAGVGPVDTLLVPGGMDTGRPDPALVERIRELAGAAERVVSVCTGAFLLAEAGLLAGRRATTHWAYGEELARRFPDVEVDPDPIHVRDGRIATSAGVTAGIDLALALVEEDLGRETALLVARHLVVFLRRPGNQAQFSTQLAAQVAARQPLREVQRWIAEHPEADLSVEALADRSALSPRHFARAFAAEVGVTPGRYVDGVRLEAARRLLEDTDHGIEEIARSCGYGTPEAMRRAFVRALAAPPAEYRRRFRPEPTGGH